MITIRRKLILYFIVPILGIGLLYFGISRYYTQKEFLRTIEQRAIDDSSHVTDRLRDAVFMNDPIPLTDAVLNEKYSNAYISYITVFNPRGEVIAHGNLDAIPSNIFSDPNDASLFYGYMPYKNTAVFNVDRPLFSGLYKIGMVRVGFDFNTIIDTFNYTAYWFIGIGLLFIISITIFVFKLSDRITKPISELKDVAMQFSQGNFVNRAHVYAADEVGDLAKAFNAMADVLKAAKDLLENERASLQSKVSELEKWQEATVGRELKMMELKKKLKLCEEKLEKIDDVSA